MAPIGQKYSYATDSPIQRNYIGEALSEVEDNSFRYRQEKRLADEKKKADEDKIDAENEAVLGKLRNPTTTKFSTQNALTIDASTKLVNAVGEKARLLKEGKISKLDYDIFKSNAMTQIDLMNQANQRINTQGVEYAKQLADGKISPVFAENALNFGKSFDENNIHFEVNQDGTLKAFAYDDPKNPTKIIEKGDLSNFGQYSFTPIANYDIDKDITEFKKTYPPILREKIIGNEKIGTEGITPEIKKAIDLKVNSLIADRNSLAVANAQRPGGNVNPNVTDEKDIEATKKFLEERYLNAYSNKITKDEAYQGANYRLSERKQANEEQEPIIRPTIGDYRSPIVIQPEDEEKGKNIVRPLGRVYKKNLGFKKDEFKLQSVGGKYNNVAVETIGLNSKGVPFITGTYAIQKGSSDGVSGISKITQGAKEKRFFYDLGHTELNSVAQRLGYENGDALTYELRRMNNYKPQTQKSQVPTYSRADLKANKWSDAQIEQAVKLGKIKVN